MDRTRHSSLRSVTAVVLSLLLGIGVLAAVGLHAPAARAQTTTSTSPGYWLAASDGGIYQYGTANFGSLRGHPLNKPVVGIAATKDGLGYWMVASDGGIFPEGDAHFYGSTGSVRLNQPIVGMAATPDGLGYWLVASDGGIFEFGDAHFYGSTGNIQLNKPIVGMAATPDGLGYWLVASDGGIFEFGDAHFYGSTGNVVLNKPVVGMGSTSDGLGYWLVASDGGIFIFGDAHFFGSTGSVKLNAPMVGMAPTSDGGGYWLVASDGGIFIFGDAQFMGSAGASHSPAPIIGMAATANGYPLPPGSTGYDVSNWQCNTTLPAARTFAVVEIAGAINGYPNPCYNQEVSWAGANVSSYIYMNGLPNPAPSESLNGPAGSCAGNVSCESYNFGWYWATHWVGVSHAGGVFTGLWWLDVESDPSWNAQSQTSNGQVVAGAVAALRASGVIPGIYSTSLQWSNITGNTVSFPNIALWIPGGGNISGGTFSAQNICSGSVPSQYGYSPFAGGKPIAVQYGLTGNGYTGPASSIDQDYACP